MEDRTKRIKIMKAGKGLQAPGEWKKPKKEAPKVPVMVQPKTGVALLQGWINIQCLEKKSDISIF